MKISRRRLVRIFFLLPSLQRYSPVPPFGRYLFCISLIISPAEYIFPSSLAFCISSLDPSLSFPLFLYQSLKEFSVMCDTYSFCLFFTLKFCVYLYIYLKCTLSDFHLNLIEKKPRKEHLSLREHEAYHGRRWVFFLNADYSCS